MKGSIPTQNYFWKYLSEIFGETSPKNAFANHTHCFYRACMWFIIKIKFLKNVHIHFLHKV